MNLGQYLLASSYPGAFPVMLFSGTWLVLIIVLVVVVVANWKLYEKAGKPGWSSIIPIYNLIVLLQIVKRPIWWIILMFIPVVSIVVMFVVSWDLAKAFGKDLAYGVGLFFLGVVFIPILAFGDAQYVLATEGGSTVPPETPPQNSPTPAV